MLLCVPKRRHIKFKRQGITQKKMFYLKNDRQTSRHLLFYFISYVLNMFRTLIHPSSGACDCVVVCSEMSSYKIQTPGNYPEENVLFEE